MQDSTTFIYVEENECNTSQIAKEILIKRQRNGIHHVGTDGEMSHNNTVELMDLPDHILVHILSYLDHNFLRHVVTRVSTEWKRLAHSKVLWSKASLYLDIGYWPPVSASKVNEIVEKFSRDILVTPYLHELIVHLKQINNEELRYKVVLALVSTCCRFQEVYLEVDDYSQALLQFLQKHNEIKKLELRDETTDDDYAAGVAATVGRLAPHLISLDLSFSRLFNLPKAGLLLASPSIPHKNPSESGINSPLGSKLQYPALDLRNVDDDDDYKTVKQEIQGLRHFKFTTDDLPQNKKPSRKWATAANNLSAFLHAHKHTLESAKVSTLSQDVWKALAECTKLEDLEVGCDQDGSSICSMMRTMQSSLRILRLCVPEALGAKGLATVLQTLCQHAPRLETLTLQDDSNEHDCSVKLFPGFKPLYSLLVGRSLRELSISYMIGLGRAELLELAAIAASANGKLSLRTLELSDQCFCSVAGYRRGLQGDPAECRHRAEDTLKSAMPSLVYLDDNYCGCVGCDGYDITETPSGSDSELSD